VKIWFARAVFFALVLLVGGLGLVVFKSNPKAWTGQEIENLVLALNEAAAVGVPHDFLMDRKQRSQHLPLLLKVERGEELTPAESTSYRVLFQATLQQNQSFLGRFDAELSVLHDYAMAVANNINSLGISGNHDHHDLSASKNMDALQEALQKLDAAQSTFARVKYANGAQKQLVDLISHMGVMPHTVSVVESNVETLNQKSGPGVHFEAMLRAFKAAQFENVNSPAYWRAIAAGLKSYNRLILDVQSYIQERTTPWERRLAGRFMALQTSPPPVDLQRPQRQQNH
jgi:hypothetical protein